MYETGWLNLTSRMGEDFIGFLRGYVCSTRLVGLGSLSVLSVEGGIYLGREAGLGTQ